MTSASKESTSTSTSTTKFKAFGFGVAAWKKHPELIPLVAIISVAVVGVGAYCVYAFTKSDVQLDRTKSGLATAPWEKIDFEKRQKFIVVEQEYKKIPELEKLKKEMGER